MDVVIGDLSPKDFGKAINFAIEGMGFRRYIESPLALRLYGRYFLYLELARATQVLAAYSGGRLVGVLMADMQGAPKPYAPLGRRLYLALFRGVMGVFFRGGPDVYDEANRAMYQAFAQQATPMGELCFLAADPALRGQGIGSKLLEALRQREKGKLIFLYTDDNCDYPFYEHKGFVRAGQRDIQMELGGKTVALTCLLYSKEL